MTDKLDHSAWPEHIRKNAYSGTKLAERHAAQKMAAHVAAMTDADMEYIATVMVTIGTEIRQTGPWGAI